MPKHQRPDLRIEIDNSEQEEYHNSEANIYQPQNSMKIQNTLQESISDIKYHLRRNEQIFQRTLDECELEQSQYQYLPQARVPLILQSQQSINHQRQNVFTKTQNHMPKRENHNNIYHNKSRLVQIENRLSENVRQLSKKSNGRQEVSKSSRLSYLSKSLNRKISSEMSKSLHFRMLSQVKKQKSIERLNIANSRNNLIKQIAGKLDERQYSSSKSRSVGRVTDNKTYFKQHFQSFLNSGSGVCKHKTENNKITSRLGKLENLLNSIKRTNKQSPLIITNQYVKQRGQQKIKVENNISIQLQNNNAVNKNHIRNGLSRNKLIHKLDCSQSEDPENSWQTPINAYNNHPAEQQKGLWNKSVRIKSLSKLTEQLRATKKQLQEVRSTNQQILRNKQSSKHRDKLRNY